jgi:hypothetical protein
VSNSTNKPQSVRLCKEKKLQDSAVKKGVALVVFSNKRGWRILLPAEPDEREADLMRADAVGC